ncbi:MAG: ThuA domain-containing protein [Candidatus Woesearchaeota archaeon]
MIKTLILVGGGEQYHDLLFAAQTLQKVLIKRNIIAEYSQDFSILTDKERLNEYDVCVFYTQNKILTIEQQKGLKKYIEKGNGFIPIHSSNVINSPENDTYLDIVGSKFIKHDPFKRFKVKLKNNHYINKDIENFEIDDELYISELVHEPDKILAWAKQDGEKHPMVYTRKLGEGKISYIALGHDGRAWNHPVFQKLFYRTVVWASQ